MIFFYSLTSSVCSRTFILKVVILLHFFTGLSEIHGRAQVEHAPPKQTYYQAEQNLIFRIHPVSAISNSTIEYTFSEEKRISPDTQFLSKKMVLSETRDRFEVNIDITGNLRKKYFLYRVLYNFANQRERFPESNKIFVTPLLSDNINPKIIFLQPKDITSAIPLNTELVFSLNDNESGIDLNATKFFINDIDFSSDLIRSGNIYKFSPLEKFPAGHADLKIICRDNTNNLTKETFQINFANKNPVEEKTASSWQGEGSVSYSLQGNQNSISSISKLSSKPLFSDSAQSGSIKYSLYNDDIRYDIGPLLMTNAPTTPGTRNNRFSLGITTKELKFQAGDTSTNFSTYTLNSALLGFVVEYTPEEINETHKYSGKFAYGQSIQGFSPPSDSIPGRYTRNSAGLYFDYTYSSNIKTYIATQMSNDIKNTSSEVIDLPKYSNYTSEIGTDFTILPWQLKVFAKYALSFTKTEQVNAGEQIGYAMTGGLSRQIEFIDGSASVSIVETSPNFLALAGGSGAPDTRTIASQLSSNLYSNILTYSNSSSYSQNNLKNQRPDTQRNYNIGNNFNLQVKNFPVFRYTNSINHTNTSGNSPVKTRNYVISNSLNSSYPFDLFAFQQSLNLTLQYNRTIDKSTPQASPETETRGITVGHQVSQNKLSVLLNFSHNRNNTLTTGDSTFSNAFGTQISYAFLHDLLKINFNYNRNLSFSEKNRSPVELTSVSDTYSLSCNLTPNDKTQFTANISHSVSGTTAEYKLFPGNFNISLQGEARF